MRYVLIAALALGACVPAKEDRTRQAPQPQACAAPSLQHLVGRPVGSFDFAALGGPLRILPPNSAVTMDHLPDRLNVHVDENDIIVRIACG